MKEILSVLKNKYELFSGWLELVLKSGFDRQYKYVMERIEIKEQQGKLFSLVHYKLVGCRKLISEPSIELGAADLERRPFYTFLM